VTLHNRPVGPRRVQVIGRLLGRVAAKADATLGVSSDIVQWARSLGAVAPERALVPARPPGPPARTPAAVRAELGLPEGAPLLLTVARLAPQKGLDLLVDVASELMAPGSGGPRPLLWAVAGEGPERSRIEARIAAAGAPAVLRGRRSDLPDLYAAASAVVSTAEWEGQPVALQEALAAGAPIVATDAGGTAETLGAAGLLTRPDAREVRDAIVRVLTQPDLACELRQRSAARARQLPTRADLAAQLWGVYHRCGWRA
jgi:glycosyltransferase involved in cell wall biosynthesis